MIILGLLLPAFAVLVTIGVLLIIVGLILLFVRPGGRRYY
jgi:hypothetical protein